MPGSSNTSFIPKRNPTHSNRPSNKQQVFLGSFIIKILFFASLIAAVGVFAYETKLNSNLEDEIVKLNNAISSFNEADMDRVLKMDLRINQAKQRLEHSVSITSLLLAIEKATSETVQITNFTLSRKDDKSFEIEASMETGSFDSVLFQREVLENGEILSISEVQDLTLQNVPPNNGLFIRNTEAGEEQEKVVVSFIALLNVDAEKIPHQATPIEIFSNTELQQAETVEQVPEEVVENEESNTQEI